jgi:hypothetical protein
MSVICPRCFRIDALASLEDMLGAQAFENVSVGIGVALRNLTVKEENRVKAWNDVTDSQHLPTLLEHVAQFDLATALSRETTHSSLFMR